PPPSPLIADNLADKQTADADNQNAQNAIQDNADNTDNSALAIYLRQNQKLATEVIESDPVAIAVADLMQDRETWQGTAAELLLSLSKAESGRKWPRTPQAIGGHLKRLAPALQTMGISIDYERVNDRLRTRRIHLTATAVESPKM
ncbi:MAG: hypothetical protein SGJ19_06435, partial [Planctomycetia bacterium]|nr:hypothetical protein [Planctomycetia bacterium]